MGIQDVGFLSTLNIAPNPSSSNMNIRFELEKSADVSIQLFDMAGRLVETISNGNMAAGIHQYTIGDNVHAGAYFLRFNVDGGSLTEKIIFTR
ncbi:MAG: T9SS type A sorting domain-containing protein [Bacteroidota bacterium]